MRAWRMSLRRTKSAIFLWAGSNIIGCEGCCRASAAERMNPRRTLKGRGMVITVKNIWATSPENVFSGIFDQVRFKPACSTTEASQNLETLDVASIHIILSKQWTIKVLIRLRGRAGWFVPLFFAYGIRHVFAWPGPYIILKTWMALRS